MGKSPLLLPLILLTVSCLDAGKTVEWPEPFEIGFLIESQTRGSGVPIGPFDANEAVGAYSLVKDHGLYLVTVSPDELRALEPRLEPAEPKFRLALVSVDLRSAPECDPDGFLHSDREEGERVERRLTDLEAADSIHVFRFDSDRGAFTLVDSDALGEWALSYAIRPCSTGTHVELSSFAPVDQLPPLFTPRYLGADSLLVTWQNRVMRLERGSGTPSASWELSTEGLGEGERWQIVDLAVLPGAGEPQRALLIAQWGLPTPVDEETRIKEMRLIELEVGSSSISMARTWIERDVNDEPRRLRGLDLDASGGFVAVGQGWWITGALDDDEPDLHLDEFFDGQLVQWTGDPELPAVVAAAEGIWLGDPRKGPGTMILERPLSVFEQRWRSLQTVRTQRGLEVYVTPNRALLSVRREGVWSEVPVYPDEPAAECTEDRTCGRRRVIRNPGSLDFAYSQVLLHDDDELIALAVIDCKGLLFHSVREGCAISAPIDGDQISIDPRLHIEGSSRWQDQIVFAGSDDRTTPASGLLIEARIEFDSAR